MPQINQKGIAHLFLIIVMVLGVGLSVWLIGQRTNIFPHAQQPIDLTPKTAFYLEQYKPVINVNYSTDNNSYPNNSITPGSEVLVNLLVSSDMELTNTFSAFITYPKDLLEVSSIVKDGQLYKPEIFDQGTKPSANPITDKKNCAQVITRACHTVYNDCKPTSTTNCALWESREECKDFSTPCDVPEGWVAVSDQKIAEKTKRNTKVKSQKKSNCKPRAAYCESTTTDENGNPTGETCYPAVTCEMPAPSSCPLPSKEMCKPGTILTRLGQTQDGCPSYQCLPIPEEPMLTNRDYFVDLWLPETGTKPGLVTLSGGIKGSGLKTAPLEKRIMATIVFKALKAGDAKLELTGDSIILSATSSANLLNTKNGLTLSIKDPQTSTSSASPTPSPSPTQIKGDLNSDGKINTQDFSYLLAKWGTNDAKADITGDGKVDIYDFSALLSIWTK